MADFKLPKGLWLVVYRRCFAGERESCTGHIVVEAQQPHPAVIEYVVQSRMIAVKWMVGDQTAGLFELIVPETNITKMRKDTPRAGLYILHN